MPFKLKHRQLPLRLAAAMTIIKGQGQTLPCMGSILPAHIFSHGQLYVALSRVGLSTGSLCPCPGEAAWPKDSGVLTGNVEIKEVFR